MSHPEPARGTVQPNTAGTPGDRLSFPLLIAAWVGIILCVDPRGDFPLNDDWGYAHPVRVLVEQGVLELHWWTDATLIVQVLWGALFCLPLGFSFEALRLSTLCAGLIGILATQRLLVVAGADRHTGVLGALVLATNPLYLNLSFTFMTDVAFTATAALTALWTVRYLRRPSGGRLLAASLLGVVAMLVRQLGLALPLALACGALVRRRTRRWFWLPPVLAGVLLAGYQLWLGSTQSVSVLRGLLARQALDLAQRDPAAFALQWTHRILAISLYLGLFLLPFLMWSAHGARRRTPEWPWLAAFAVAACLLSAGALSQGPLPLLPNVIFDLGLGPVTLRDEYILKLGRWPALPQQVWLVVTAMALIGAVWAAWEATRLLRDLRSSEPDGEGRAVKVFGLSAILIYLAPSSLVEMGDRYLLFVIPFGMMLVQLANDVTRGAEAAARSRLQRAMRPVSIVLIAVIACYSLAGTHDYLAWNRVRWSLLDYLESQQSVATTRIDGGFEFNGLRNFRYPFRVEPGKSWWWVDDDEFMVTLGPVPGYQTLRRVTFRRWLPPGEGALFLLRRLPEPEASPRDPSSRMGR